MKRKRKFISIIMAVFIIASLLTSHVFASQSTTDLESDIQFTSKCVEIVFPNGDWQYEAVTVDVRRSDAILDALNCVVSGKNIPSHCYNEFPKKTKIEEVRLEGDTAFVVFAKDISNKVDNKNYSYDIMKQILAKNVFELDPSIENVVLVVNESKVAIAEKHEVLVEKNDTNEDVAIQKELESKIKQVKTEINGMSEKNALEYIEKNIVENESLLSVSVSSLAGKKFVVDAGHGGHSDYGATRTYNGVTYYEKNLNLDIAKALKNYLVSQGAYLVLMTRTTDTTVSLTSRYTLANTNQVNAFISCHCNSSVFPWENGTTAIYPANHDISKSSVLASQCNTGVYEFTPFNWISPYKDTRGLAVLNATKMPAIIMETGHMSNDSDMSYLKTLANRQNIGKYIGYGVVSYINQGN